MIVRDIMKKDVATIDAEALISDAAKIMSSRLIGSLVVVKNNNVVGILTERDILLQVTEGKPLSNVKVKDIMSSPVITISPETDIEEAANVMIKNIIRRLPVMEGQKLVGIITSEDIIGILATIKMEVSKEVRSICDTIIRIRKERERERTEPYIR